MAMLEVRDLHLFYQSDEGPVHAVRGVSFTVEESAFYTLLGPSGCGKTSTLRSIAGLETPSSGEITIGDAPVFSSETGRAIPAHKRDVGMVFQSYAIWPHMSVFENVAFPLRNGRLRLVKSDTRERVLNALELVHLETLADRPAPQLSGGQQQRVALARALVHEPKVLLLDEPLSNLDAKLREEMRRELKDLTARLHITVLYVTHDQVEALTMSDEMAVMGEGLIIQEGAPKDIYLRPTTSFVANFVGKTNVLEGKVDKVLPDGSLGRVQTAHGPLNCPTPAWVTEGSEVLVVFRPEILRISVDAPDDQTNVLEGSLVSASFVGDVVDYQVEVGDRLFNAKGDPFESIDPGTKVYLSIPGSRCFLVSAADPVAAVSAADQAEAVAAAAPGENATS